MESLDPLLQELQLVLQREIPLCEQMGISVRAFAEGRLSMDAPLAPNTNPHRTGFAGSLNALCTVTGWGRVFLLLREHRLDAGIVIRRSDIRYLLPVETPQITANSLAIAKQDQDYFLEMLAEKGQGKIDLHVEIEDGSQTSVSFHGSYVATVP